MAIEKWCSRMIITLANPVIARAEFTLCRAFGSLEIFASQILVKTKQKGLPSERGTPGTVP